MVPKPSSLSFGFGFLGAARVTVIVWFTRHLAWQRTVPNQGQAGSRLSPPSIVASYIITRCRRMLSRLRIHGEGRDSGTHQERDEDGSQDEQVDRGCPSIDRAYAARSMLCTRKP